MSTDFGFKASDMPGYFFISYNTEDSVRIAEICKHLVHSNIHLWYDEGIPHDSMWESVLAEKIDHCQEAIFFITRGIFEKGQTREKDEIYTYKEYDLARRYKKKMLIVLLDEIDDSIVPYSLMSWWQKIDPSIRQGVIGYNQSYYDVAQIIKKELGFSVSDSHSIVDDIQHPIFNSVKDHPILGDERQFVFIREGGESNWFREIKLVPGKQYEVEIRFRNDANPKYNTSEYNNRGVAFQTRMSIDLPYIVYDDSKITVRINSDNAANEAIDYVLLNTYEGKGVKARFVLGQSKIFNNWKTNDNVLSSNLFTYDGTYLGLNELNGIVPGGDEYRGYLRFYIDVEDI